MVKKSGGEGSTLQWRIRGEATLEGVEELRMRETCLPRHRVESRRWALVDVIGIPERRDLRFEELLGRKPQQVGRTHVGV